MNKQLKDRITIFLSGLDDTQLTAEQVTEVTDIYKQLIRKPGRQPGAKIVKKAEQAPVEETQS